MRQARQLADPCKPGRDPLCITRVSPSPEPPPFAGLVTAAGASSRMGRPKALVPWRGTPLLVHQARSLAALGEELGGIVVVLGHAHEAIRAALADDLATVPGVTLVDNARWSLGRSSSLEIGLGALRSTSRPNALAFGRGLFVTAVDQPLDTSIILALAHAFTEGDEILQPSHAGRRGHPLLLAPAIASRLAHASSYPMGLRTIVHASHVRTLEVESATIHLDLNTPDDLAR